MLLTEQYAKTKRCFQPRNAETKCVASDCCKWRWWPDRDGLLGYCGLAGVPLMEADISPAIKAEVTTTAKKRPR